MRVLIKTLLLTLLFFPLGAAAATINLAASIDGAQANAGAGTGSSGTGSAAITFDDATNLLSWSGSWSGLTQPFTVAHFHGPAAPGVNAGVTVGISVVLDPGSLGGTFNGSSTLSAGQAADLLGGLWYINIHSSFAPGGEIRGQVLAVPEPGMVALLGLAGVALVTRRISA